MTYWVNKRIYNNIIVVHVTCSHPPYQQEYIIMVVLAGAYAV